VRVAEARLLLPEAVSWDEAQVLELPGLRIIRSAIYLSLLCLVAVAGHWGSAGCPLAPQTEYPALLDLVCFRGRWIQESWMHCRLQHVENIQYFWIQCPSVWDDNGSMVHCHWEKILTLTAEEGHRPHPEEAGVTGHEAQATYVAILLPCWHARPSTVLSLPPSRPPFWSRCVSSTFF
jgi:hypothetical protein